MEKEGVPGSPAIMFDAARDRVLAAIGNGKKKKTNKST